MIHIPPIGHDVTSVYLVQIEPAGISGGGISPDVSPAVAYQSQETLTSRYWPWGYLHAGSLLVTYLEQLGHFGLSTPCPLSTQEDKPKKIIGFSA